MKLDIFQCSFFPFISAEKSNVWHRRWLCEWLMFVNYAIVSWKLYLIYSWMGAVLIRISFIFKYDNIIILLAIRLRGRLNKILKKKMNWIKWFVNRLMVSFLYFLWNIFSFCMMTIIVKFLPQISNYLIKLIGISKKNVDKIR